MNAADAILRGILKGWERALDTPTGSALRAGPFITTFSDVNDLVWLNYAVPITYATDSAVTQAIELLRAEFQKRGRFLRFEFIEVLFPTLEAILQSAGLVSQAELPILACAPTDLVSVRVDDLRIVTIDDQTEDRVIREWITVRDSAFGEPKPLDDASVGEFRTYLAKGMRVVAGYFGRELAGVACLLTGGEVSELAGVGTVSAHRRRKVASALCEHLCKEHFASGGTAVWLSAGTPVAKAVYEKLGFRVVGTQLNYIDRNWPGLTTS